MTDSTFDYIVVGAGSSGAVVAHRLCNKGKNRVLLLEAGGPGRNPWLHIPIGYYRNILHPDLSWNFKTQPHEATGNRVMNWPRGRVLGGSSAINGLVYVRGQREDFYHWHQLGNSLWNYDDVLPFFKMAENNIKGPGTFHGDSGPLEVTDSLKSELGDAYIKACREAGLVTNDDFNGESQEGAGYFQLTVTRSGRRSSTSFAYLNPLLKKDWLTIETRALTEKVLFDGKRAVGVQFRQGPDIRQAFASKEVIICGGAINSPQILQLSGVGPAALLEEHNIPLVHPLPGVGENLQDHYQARIVYECSKPITFNDLGNSWLKKAFAGLQYALTRKGPLTLGAGQVGVFARTSNSVPTPDVQFHFIPFSAAGPGQGLHKYPGFTVSVCQLRPRSRGSVKIQSANAGEHPLIQPNYLTSPFDEQTMLDGLKLIRKVADTPTMQRYIASEKIPGDVCMGDDDMMSYIRENGSTIFHPSGTCKMGDDDMAVVDEQLKVHGIDNLRVADASIMPTVLSGNTNAGCIMIGEKLAAMMLAEDAA